MARGDRVAVAVRERSRTALAMSGRGRSLAGACVAHLLHDGYTDLLYVLLPVWQKEFGLSFTGLALIRCLYSGTMGGLQIPAARATARLGSRLTLVWASLIAAAGYLVMALPGGLAVLAAGLVLAGVGSSAQHPHASLLVSQAYGRAARRPLGIYNFAGDLGKAAFPPVVALLLAVTAWRPTLGLMALLGVAAALALLPLLPRQPVIAAADATPGSGSASRSGFGLLLAVGALDTATRMGYLLFLPFLLHAKGAAGATVGFSFAALFAGGALGKAACGWLGDRLGVVRSVIVTEIATTALIVATQLLPLGATLMLLPPLGIVLNGTSSLLYATVPELAPRGDSGRAFAVFYTAVIGSAALAPIAYGSLGDHIGQSFGILVSGLTALSTVPLILRLRHRI